MIALDSRGWDPEEAEVLTGQADRPARGIQKKKRYSQDKQAVRYPTARGIQKKERYSQDKEAVQRGESRKKKRYSQDK